MKRTHLPLNGLRVFDAAARHLSFTRAADELAVTPAAVGQQIRALEDMLGVVLFRRTPRGLELTPEAEAGLPALRSAFLELEESVRAMQAGQSSQHLTIAAPRDLTAKWLSARLAAYAAQEPGVQFMLVAADDALDFTEANLDLALRLTDGAGEHEGVALGEPRFVTVGAPDGGGLESPIAWPGCPVDDGKAIVRVADAGLAIDAAANGLGRACVPALLAEADIATGRVSALGEPRNGPGYWLIAPLPQWRQKKVKALVAALSEG
ncbi:MULTISPECIES: LysR family transcriptional regulator [unclassified Sphingobium]|uniref:LysR family transcriptional regulator n=1 Tax=unclassified Sphingobium TaxID=2611147 RepID=UPI0022240A77|nr:MULTISPECIES: LysR family transcriptional regulator [unclassified Sphingobium]MCW2396764.1 LysR family glycine cleavage system transcriptional activator [Sphingobium sp. B8D3B]MCW2420281.1 LysR family glycine cleavage system transcriptional activator [Sphingobium sp. B8D3C]